MSDIRINPEKLESAAARLEKLEDSLREEQKRVSQVREGVENGWRSTSSGLFLESLEITENNIRELARLSQETAGKLLSLAAEARRIERENTASFAMR